MKHMSKEVKIVQKNQMKITEMKYTIKEKETFLEGFSSTEVGENSGCSRWP